MVEEATASLGEMVTRFERGLVESALRKSSGSVQLAADALGVPRKTLYDKLARLNIDISAVRTSGG
jgi:two-component system, NtrC family, C4-dicarboxylate transport response regulator DctD